MGWEERVIFCSDWYSLDMFDIWPPWCVCVFSLSFVLLYLDFSLNYSVYILSNIKIHHVYVNSSVMFWNVRQLEKVFCVLHTTVWMLLFPYLFLNKCLPRGGQGAPEPFFPIFTGATGLWFISFLTSCLGIPKSGLLILLRKRSQWIFNTVKGEK